MLNSATFPVIFIMIYFSSQNLFILDEWKNEMSLEWDIFQAAPGMKRTLGFPRGQEGQQKHLSPGSLSFSLIELDFLIF